MSRPDIDIFTAHRLLRLARDFARSRLALPDAVWRRTMRPHHCGFPESVWVEITPDLTYRVRCPQSGAVLVESQPGEPSKLAVPHVRKR